MSTQNNIAAEAASAPTLPPPRANMIWSAYFPAFDVLILERSHTVASATRWLMEHDEHLNPSDESALYQALRRRKSKLLDKMSDIQKAAHVSVCKETAGIKTTLPKSLVSELLKLKGS